MKLQHQLPVMKAFDEMTDQPLGIPPSRPKNDRVSFRPAQMGTEGEMYEGEWLDNRREGYGEFHSAGGDTYEGEWKDDAPNGATVLSSCNSHPGYACRRLDGLLSDTTQQPPLIWHPSGIGRWTYADGSWFEGVLRLGGRVEGVLSSADGHSLYRGM